MVGGATKPLLGHVGPIGARQVAVCHSHQPLHLAGVFLKGGCYGLPQGAQLVASLTRKETELSAKRVKDGFPIVGLACPQFSASFRAS